MVCISVSALCFGLCVFVLMRTMELQSRILSLEQQQDEKFTAWMMTLEQVEPLIVGRLDQLLEEVRLHQNILNVARSSHLLTFCSETFHGSVI